MPPKMIAKFRMSTPRQIISENGPRGAGEVVCECGQNFTHDLTHNMQEKDGFVYPVCPSCETIPMSETRQIDL